MSNSFKKTKVTVCGGGRGGLSMAADLTLAGHEVTLFQLPEFADSIEPVLEQGGILISGDTASGKTGLAKPYLITTDPAEAFIGTELIMVAIPGNGHETLFKTITPHLQDGQVVVVNTGYWASLRFQSLLREYEKDVTIAETNLLVYLTGLVNPGEVRIAATKESVKIAAMPAKENKRVLELVRRLYPQFEEASNILEVNLRNLNAFMHTPIVLTNLSLIERLGMEPFYFYRDGASESACRLMEEVDKERMALAKALNIEVPNLMESEIEMYGKFGTSGSSVYEVKKSNNSAQQFVLESANGTYGMIEEDLPYTFIPFILLGEQLGVNMEVTRALTLLLSLGLDKNYWDVGLSAEELGLSGMEVEQIKSYVLEGWANVQH